MRMDISAQDSDPEVGSSQKVPKIDNRALRENGWAGVRSGSGLQEILPSKVRTPRRPLSTREMHL